MKNGEHFLAFGKGQQCEARGKESGRRARGELQ